MASELNDPNLNQEHRGGNAPVLFGFKKLAVVLLLVVALIGIGWFANSNSPTTPYEKVAGPASLATQRPELRPVSIKIPAIGVDALVIDLGLKRNGELDVPDSDKEVGWYINGATPGEIGDPIGALIMVGHLNSIRGPAVFSKLNQLKKDDIIEVTRTDGSVITYRADNSEIFAQNNFPTGQVYGKVEVPSLRLITCAGKYSIFMGRYSDNLIVYATMR